MKTPLAPLLALVLAAVAPFSAGASAQEAADGATRRFALAIGSHEGGKGRDRLLFAGSDALAFRRTLEDLGGLNPGDAALLIDPDSAQVLRSLEALEARVKAAKREGARTEAVVYYSGHADENGLLLGKQSVEYRVFRNRMNALGADVRIAVVDACASGALTRMKGGQPVPAFLVDKSAHAEGYAFLTSSSESEVAQESDRIRGSFFTHALNTGLRGAADATRDGKVTLHEAYQFAYHETLARTVSTRGGPQHAAYDIQLSGSGDVVLTDLRQASASLALAEELHGRLFIRDSLDHLAAELNKPAGREMNLGLPPGSYGLRLQQGARWSAASVTLREGRTAMLATTAFRPVDSEMTVSRGGSGDGGTAADTGFHHVPITGEAGFASSIFYDVQNEPWHGTQLALAVTDARSHLRGGQLAMAFNVTRGDLEGWQAAIGTNAVGGSLHGFQGAQANVVFDNLRGAQIASIFGVAGGSVRGFQGSGIFNIAGGGLDGWQLAGIFGVSGGATRGAQLAGIFNATADSVHGLQGAGIFNAAGGNVTGGQGAGVFNVAGGKVAGVQGAGIFNAARGDVEGVQGAGILNAGAGEVHGVQAAGILNASMRLRGFQIAPILNITGKADGYQIGLVNLSDEYESGAPIGLVNISRKGSFEGEVWVEETGLVFTGLRTGTRWMHSQLAVGVKKIGDRQILAPTLGVAGEFNFGASPLYLETGLLYSTLFEARDYSLNDASVESDWSRVRVGLGWKILPWLTVVGGAAYNVMYHPHSDRPVTGKDYPFLTTVSNNVSFWPGAFAGIRVGR